MDLQYICGCGIAPVFLRFHLWKNCIFRCKNEGAKKVSMCRVKHIQGFPKKSKRKIFSAQKKRAGVKYWSALFLFLRVLRVFVQNVLWQQPAYLAQHLFRP